MTDGIRINHPAQGRVTGDRVELAFGYWPGRGAPLVALHGLTASHVSFAGVAECLAGRRPLFALDLRGRGDSGKPAGPYGMAQHAEDVAAAMGAMGLGASIIVGHSMGAFVATALAAAHPELVSGLLLIDGGYAPAISAPNSQQGLDAALALRITQLRQTYPSREVYRRFWRTQPHFPPEDWSPWVEAFLDYEIGGEAPELRPKAAEDAVKADLLEGLQSEQIAARLKAISVPVLMVRAPAGFVPGAPPLFPDAMIEQMRKHAPAMGDELIAGTTHYTLLMGKKGAARIADLADEFAAQCESSSASGRNP
jgi:pimeloyl-ACP methyl ester carboxylesterase